jgi:hypothetical protein
MIIGHSADFLLCFNAVDSAPQTQMQVFQHLASWIKLPAI